MKFLALDIGTKRIGVATCDRLEIAATPHSVIPGNRHAPGLVADLVAREEADGVVVGLPISLSGAEGENCRFVRAFIEKLQPLLTVPIETIDERYTTSLAEASLIEAGLRRDRRKELRDAVSAALILKTFLERRRFQRDRDPPGPPGS